METSVFYSKNMKKEKEKKEEILAELYKQYPIDEMVKFDEFNIADKLQENSYWIVHFKNELLIAITEYEQLEEMLETLIGKQYDYYRFDYDKELDKTEIKNYYLPKDKKIRHMKRILARQKIKVEFFKYCVAGMEKQQWNMKNFLENLKVNV